MKKNENRWIYSFLIIFTCLFLTGSCKKNDDGKNNTVADIDGNVYRTVTIGTQVWMAENLKTTKYSTGASILYITDAAQWQYLTNGSYCNYDNQVYISNTFGHLYNWNAVNDSRKICPSGWHIPDKDEWQVLLNFAGGYNTAAALLKAKGTDYWFSTTSATTNETGFTALPGGMRKNDGQFLNLTNSGHWWSNTEYNSNSAWRVEMDCSSDYVQMPSTDKKYGLSVRCLKD